MAKEKAAVVLTAVRREVSLVAQGGDRIVANGKVIWQGLGNRSGLHSFAEDLIREKWAKSGARFERKLADLPDGTRVEVRQFYNRSRDRGEWVPVRTLVLR